MCWRSTLNASFDFEDCKLASTFLEDERGLSRPQIQSIRNRYLCSQRSAPQVLYAELECMALVLFGVQELLESFFL